MLSWIVTFLIGLGVVFLMSVGVVLLHEMVRTILPRQLQEGIPADRAEGHQAVDGSLMQGGVGAGGLGQLQQAWP